MLPLFKKSHIHSRHIEDLLKTGYIRDYAVENNKRNALRQASFLYRIIDGELFRHGTDREYSKYGLRLVVHDDEPDKKAEIIAKCHLDDIGNHLGMNNTIKNVGDTYYWQGISAHVKMYLKQCEKCKTRSKFNAEEWLVLERKNIDKKKELAQITNEAQREIKNLGRVKKPTPPETFFIVNAERKVDFETTPQDGSMMIDSNNIEYVVETLGQSDGFELEEVCHVLNVPDILPIPERFRSREIETFLKDGTYPDDFTSNMKCGLRGPASQYRLIDGELYHEGNKVGSKGMRLVIHDDLPALKVKVMVECHIDEDGSHHGLNKTLSKIGEKYHWSGMSVDVRKFMMHCKICSEQRGRKTTDDREYQQEAQEVKSRISKKMNETEASGSDMELTALPVSYDSTDIEPTEGLEQEGHQVIRLIGPNKEVTEITVAVVNQETVTADGIEPNQIIQESNDGEELHVVTGKTGKGQSLLHVTKEMTDAVAQIEAAEAAMEIAALKQEDVNEEETEVKGQDEEVNNDEKTKEILVMKTETGEVLESENADAQDETTYSGDKSDEVVAVVSETVVPQGEMEQMETEEGVVGVLVIKEGENNHEEIQEVTTVVENDELVETDRMVVLASGDEHTMEEIAGQNNSDVASGLNLHVLTSCVYYKDAISVPEVKKTRIIENFLKLGEGVEGFCHSKLIEMSENFEIVDDVLYRRSSRYKGRQVVIHDDMPEVKDKLIKELHLKRNGQHCSELITFQNVSFKYYWEEMKWDIHRWYTTCNTCVNEGGYERKTNKRILSVSEQKKYMEEKRRENRLINPFKAVRNKHREKYGNNQWFAQVLQTADCEIKKLQGTQGRVIFKVEGPGASEDSDVEIHIPESADNVKPHVLKVGKVTDPAALYDLVVYATLEQEQHIKNMYAKKHWNYNPISLTKAANDEVVSDDDEDYYLLTIKVTAFQENAIQQLFQTMGLAIESTEEPTSLETQSQEHDIQEINLNAKDRETATSKPDAAAQNHEQVNRKEEGLIRIQEIVVKTRESAAQTQEAVFKEQDIVQNKEKEEKETKKTPVQELQKHVKEAVVVKQKVVQTPVKVVSEGQQMHGSPGVKLSSVTVRAVTVPVVKSVTEKTIEKNKSPAPVTTVAATPIMPAATPTMPAATPTMPAATPKRKIGSVQSLDTPVSEARRSRREIKRPRRFSPDSSPQRSITVKIEPEGPTSDSQNKKEGTELQEQEIGSRPTKKAKVSSINSEIVSSPKKSSSDTPETMTVRSTRSAQTLPKINVARNLRSRSETEEEINKVELIETKKTKAWEDMQKAKVSVMSKGRIRVKKIPLEDNSKSQTKAKDTSLESEEDVEMDEIISDDLKEGFKEKEPEKMEEDETVEETDDEDDDSDDEDDDDMDETEDMKVPLHIMLEDGINGVEAVEVEGGFVCSLCNAKFRNKTQCVQHGTRKLCYKECELCGKLYKKDDLEQYKTHVELHKNGQKVPCSDCNKVFFSDEHLKIHLRYHKNEVVTKCSRCKEDFYTWFQYASHMVHTHGECNMFTCDVCSAKFANISFMKNEIKFDGKLSYFRCVMCS